MVRRNSNINIQPQIDAVSALALQALNSANQAQSVSLGVSTSRPFTKPSLSLDFANSRGIDSRIKITRPSLGTYVTRNGKIATALAGIPRFTHDPLTKESLGLLMEETRTNLILYSNNLANSAWGKTECTGVVSSLKFLDDSFATEIIESANASAHNFSSTYSNFLAGDTLSCSAFVKRGAGNRHIRLELNSLDSVNAVKVYFDLTTNTFVSSSIAGLGQLVGIPKIEKYSEGWVRVSFQAIVDNVSTSGRLQIVMQFSNSGVASYQGDGVSSLLISGVQVEKGLSVSMPIKTDGSIQTRTTDFINITGSLFLEIFPSLLEGTLFVSAKKAEMRLSQSYKSYARFLGETTAGGSNSIGLTDHANIPKIYNEIYQNGVYQYLNTLINVDLDNYFLSAFAFKNNDCRSCINAVYNSLDGDVNLPTNLNQFQIGGDMNTIIKCISFYPRRISDTSLFSLTSNLLSGKNSDQVPTNGDLKSGAYFSLAEILRQTGKQEIPVDGTGGNYTRIVRRTYDFNFEIEESTGASFSSTPPFDCLANTDYTLTFNAPLGRTILYSITKKFD